MKHALAIVLPTALVIVGGCASPQIGGTSNRLTATPLSSSVVLMTDAPPPASDFQLGAGDALGQALFNQHAHQPKDWQYATTELEE